MNEALEARIDYLSDLLDADRHNKSAAKEMNYLLNTFINDPRAKGPEYSPEHSAQFAN